MASMEMLIQDLLSDDIWKRYDAARQLQIEEELPIEAIHALRKATKDPDPSLSVAASRVLKHHGFESPRILENPNPLTNLEKLSISAMTTFIAFSVFMVSTLIASEIIRRTASSGYDAAEGSQNFLLFSFFFLLIPTMIFVAILSAVLLYKDSRILPHVSSARTLMLRLFIIGLACGILVPSVFLFIFS